MRYSVSGHWIPADMFVSKERAALLERGLLPYDVLFCSPDRGRLVHLCHPRCPTWTPPASITWRREHCFRYRFVFYYFVYPEHDTADSPELSRMIARPGEQWGGGG